MILELHLLQSFPTSNLNRDDVGQPKTVTFGGATRGRVSSQCLKRSARLLFTEYGLDPANAGIRTKRLVDKATAELVTRGHDEATARGVAAMALRVFGFGLKGDLMQYLLFVGTEAVARLCDYCETEWDKLAAAHEDAVEKQKKDRKKNPEDGEAVDAEPSKLKPDKAAVETARAILDARRVADIALFGRMIADNKDFNVNAASQVAHAISTHAVVPEFDYYTAVDDLKPEAEAGADMIGTVDFNAACYYRYANLDLTQLGTNLDGDDELAQQAARTWLHAFVHAVPSGKQNSMGARTLPETLLGVVRTRGAWNLANAFLSPVSEEEMAKDGLMEASTRRLADHFNRLRGFYGDDELHTVCGASLRGPIENLPAGETAGSLDGFADRLLTAARS